MTRFRDFRQRMPFGVAVSKGAPMSGMGQPVHSSELDGASRPAPHRNRSSASSESKLCTLARAPFSSNANRLISHYGRWLGPRWPLSRTHAIPSTCSKWRSADTRSAPVSMAWAAIQTSFVGMGRPFARSDAAILE